MRRSDLALHIQPALLEEARALAEQEGVSVDQFVNTAVAEKVDALKRGDFFRQRAAKANLAEAINVLDQLGHDNPPRKGDELASSMPSGGGQAKRIADTRVSEQDKDFVKQFVIPLIVENSDGIGILGTGVLLSVSQRTFLISASHVLTKLTEKPDTVGVPLQAAGSKGVTVLTLGDLHVWLPKRESVFDVAIAEIRSTSVVKELRFWPRVEREFFGSADDQTEVFLTAGYPGFLSQYSSSHLKSGVFFAAMPPYQKSIAALNSKIRRGEIRGAEPIDFTVDLLFEYPEAIIAADGTKVPNFSFRGISGAPVWSVRSSPLHLAPRDHLKLVGFESAVVPGELVRAKRSELVLRMLDQVAHEP
jgi:hypothetical protein